MDELTFYNSIHTGAEIDKGVTGGINALRIDAAPQALTEAEKKRVRERLGIQGNSFEIAGYFATLAALQAAVTNPAPGAAYGVGSAPPYNIYVWDGVNEVWVNNGPISAEGISAYDYAVSGGYTGSETAFTQAMSQFPEHHTRHEAGGIDQINVTAGMIPDKAITRAKLANDALYSPVKFITTADYTVAADDTGKTLVVNVSNNVTINLTQQVSLAMNGRDEIAVLWLSADSVTIVSNGVRFATLGETALITSPVKISEPHGACSLKRIAGDTTYGDIWFATGNVEVGS